MAISVLTDWTLLINEGVNTATATFPSSLSAGSNRIVQIMCVMYNGSGNTLSPLAVTANDTVLPFGITATATFVDGDIISQTRLSLAVWQFLESDIANILNKTITSSGGTGTKSVLYRVLQDAKQAVPAATNKAYTTSNATQTMSLARLANSLTSGVSWTNLAATSLTQTNPARVSTVTMTSTRRVSYGSAADTANTSNFVVAGQGYTTSLVMNMESAPAQAIVSVNGGAGISAGSAGNTAQLSGFVSPPTGGNIGGVSFTNFSYNAGTQVATFDLPMYSDGSTWPAFDSTATVTITDGTNSPILNNVPTNPPAGYSNQVISSPATDGSTYLYDHTDVSNHEVSYPNGGYNATAGRNNIALSSDGGFTVTASFAGTYMMYKRDLTSGLVTLLNVTINEAGQVTDVKSLTTRGLTSRSITERAITARGL